MEEEDIDFYNECGNYDYRYTCPACYHDHLSKVDKCDNSGVKRHCYDEEITRHTCAQVKEVSEDDARNN